MGIVGEALMLGQARLLDADNAGLIAAKTELLAPPPRLLVIDDDTLHRMVICRVAAKAGYIPAGAPTYEEAAKLAQANTFDCITLDLLLMPACQRRNAAPSSSSRLQGGDHH